MSEPRRVGFQGALGAFSEEAAIVLAPDAEPRPHETFEAVAGAVQGGSDALGVVPVENTLAGVVTEAYDALEAHDVQVIAEAAIPIRHCLLGLSGTKIEALREVRSHPVALAQCRRFFRDHPWVSARAVYDTAGAAEGVDSEGSREVAAIASHRAGERYGLDVLREDLQDRADNQTRFYLLVAGRTGAHLPGADPCDGFKTSCVVELENRAGALHELLGVFARRALSLTHVTSRPASTPWTYRFIVEFEHPSLDEGREAADEARSVATRVRPFGTFTTRIRQVGVAKPGARFGDTGGGLDSGFSPRRP